MVKSNYFNDKELAADQILALDKRETSWYLFKVFGKWKRSLFQSTNLRAN